MEIYIKDDSDFISKLPSLPVCYTFLIYFWFFFSISIFHIIQNEYTVLERIFKSKKLVYPPEKKMYILHFWYWFLQLGITENLIFNRLGIGTRRKWPYYAFNSYNLLFIFASPDTYTIICLAKSYMFCF